MRVGYLGDPHSQHTNLAETEKLMEFCVQTYKEKNLDMLVIMGDLMHNHSIVKVSCLNFWNRWFNKLNDEKIKTNVLIGNHDLESNSLGSESSLDIFSSFFNNQSTVKIVKGLSSTELLAFIPYIHEEEDFVKRANMVKGMLGAKVLICHQTFQGASYDNGFYAPNGFDQSKLNYNLIISGHIHTAQRFGKVIYPGTPRPLTASDANQDKGLLLIDHDNTTGAIVSEEFLSTSHIIEPYVSVSWKENEEKPVFKESNRTVVELIGSSAWVSEQRSILKDKVKITTRLTDRSNKKERKAGKNIEDFIRTHYETNSDKETLINYMKEKSLV